MIKIENELEQVANSSIELTASSCDWTDYRSSTILLKFEAMACLVIGMLNRSIDSYVRVDESLGKSVVSQVVDVRELARYTHIGIDDQARAVAAIPAPRSPQPPLPDQNPWECAGSDSGGKPCHLPSSADNRVTMELATVNEENPCGNRGFHLLCQPLAPDGTKDEKWRRRGSNPRPATFP